MLLLSKGESWDSTSRNRPISSEAENRHRSFGEEDGREGVLGEGEFVGPGDDDEREGALGEGEFVGPGDDDEREGVLGEGEFVGPGDDDEREGALGGVEVNILERRSKHCLL